MTDHQSRQEPRTWSEVPVVNPSVFSELGMRHHLSDQHDVHARNAQDNPWELHGYLHYRGQGDGHRHAD